MNIIFLSCCCLHILWKFYKGYFHLYSWVYRNVSHHVCVGGQHLKVNFFLYIIVFMLNNYKRNFTTGCKIVMWAFIQNISIFSIIFIAYLWYILVYIGSFFEDVKIHVFSVTGALYTGKCLKFRQKRSFDDF